MLLHRPIKIYPLLLFMMYERISGEHLTYLLSYCIIFGPHEAHRSPTDVLHINFSSAAMGRLLHAGCSSLIPVALLFSMCLSSSSPATFRNPLSSLLGKLKLSHSEHVSVLFSAIFLSPFNDRSLPIPAPSFVHTSMLMPSYAQYLSKNSTLKSSDPLF